MSQGFSTAEKRSRLNFLCKRTAMSPICMTCWLECDEFVDRIWDVIRSGVLIDDEVLLSVIHPLYEEIADNRERYPGFKIQGARRGMHQLERACARIEA